MFTYFFLWWIEKILPKGNHGLMAPSKYTTGSFVQTVIFIEKESEQAIRADFCK